MDCCAEDAIYSIENGLEQKPFRKEKNKRIPRYFHSDFKKLVDEGMGVCGTIGESEYCDDCNLTDRRLVFPVSELAPLKKTKKGRRGVKKKEPKEIEMPLFPKLF